MRAFDLPIESRERKKLFPASSPRTFEASTMVKEETPGKIKFFKISVPVAEALIKHTLGGEGVKIYIREWEAKTPWCRADINILADK